MLIVLSEAPAANEPTLNWCACIVQALLMTQACVKTASHFHGNKAVVSKGLEHSHLCMMPA